MGSYRNPLAPQAFMGMQTGPYVDRPFIYPYDITLTANQSLTNQTVSLMTDSDFYLRGIWISTSTGTFSFRWSDSSSYYFAPSLIASANMSTFAGQPFPVIPEVWYPAGGKIGVDIQDTSGATNVVEVIFSGVKRFRA